MQVVTEQQAPASANLVQGEVLDVDYDEDVIRVRLDDGREASFPFVLFDSQDVYQSGQRFVLNMTDAGDANTVVLSEAPSRTTLGGYVDSVDQDDELVWVYLRNDEGWHRKVMPLQLFVEQG